MEALTLDSLITILPTGKMIQLNRRDTLMHHLQATQESTLQGKLTIISLIFVILMMDLAKMIISDFTRSDVNKQILRCIIEHFQNGMTVN